MMFVLICLFGISEESRLPTLLKTDSSRTGSVLALVESSRYFNASHVTVSSLMEWSILSTSYLLSLDSETTDGKATNWTTMIHFSLISFQQDCCGYNLLPWNIEPSHISLMLPRRSERNLFQFAPPHVFPMSVTARAVIKDLKFPASAEGLPLQLEADFGTEPRCNCSCQDLSLNPSPE
ncbi:hypothetical protein P692DRAFT_20150082 [Suillus brevipes Sb2]|nr:hypothetical protein P692DRAFT_20150082 [Suillus brevipes Sb2]